MCMYVSKKNFLLNSTYDIGSLKIFFICENRYQAININHFVKFKGYLLSI